MRSNKNKSLQIIPFPWKWAWFSSLLVRVFCWTRNCLFLTFQMVKACTASYGVSRLSFASASPHASISPQGGRWTVPNKCLEKNTNSPFLPICTINNCHPDATLQSEVKKVLFSLLHFGKLRGWEGSVSQTSATESKKWIVGFDGCAKQPSCSGGSKQQGC